MAITTGNLLTDPDAQSFISVADADAYLMPEQRIAWDLATNTAREAALVTASRWLASTMAWRSDLLAYAMPAADLVRIGQVTARLAVEALSTDLYAATVTGKTIKRAKAGSAEVEYADDAHRAQAAGRLWPWLLPMLGGLIGNSGALRRVVRA